VWLAGILSITYGIGIFIFNPMWHLHTLKKIWQDSCRKAGLPLIEIASQQLNTQEATPL
jgi:hypothetical protein|tara:strand:+ start:693 stop:869 length:177 start_codon:yes stop_codon:yes gene_type:complete